MSRRGRDYAEARDHRPQASSANYISFQWTFIKSEMKQRGRLKRSEICSLCWKTDTSRKRECPGSCTGRLGPATWVWTVQARGPLTICYPSSKKAFHRSRRPWLQRCPPSSMCLCLGFLCPNVLRNTPISRKTDTLRSEEAKWTTPKLLPLHPISYDLASSEGSRDT